MKRFLLFLSLIIILSCSKHESQLTSLKFEKDLIPEGIAIDPQSQTLFLNSLRKNKIVSSKLDGNHPRNFINNSQFGYLPGFGMTVKGDTLYALGNSLPKGKNKSVLLLLNVKTGSLIESYKIDNNVFTFLNDLAISPKNEIFITDSESNKIYRIQRPSNEMEIYLDSVAVEHSNGIAISDDGKKLYLASRKGIRIVDIASKEILNKANKENSGIDGLKFYQNSLIGIMNGKKDANKNGVYRFDLNKEGSTIHKTKKMVSPGENFRIPTTLAIADDYCYYVVHSQLDNFSGETNQIVDTDKLESYRLMKMKLE
ncbi:SMP-30/gluconolactonase/LRE family protein [Xanthovirga aplysinae]|uniref:SMP-30/gluconolactonase/LRE family protein n=1 Tax=Xanthovirga aplysinae TaxID=2529853 RepID=UPI0012BD6CF2|nr:SMP-30/gluconolactonase/LRE family protein [Xanthovirga aplysinae]MTI30000.1 hypothetical protein [Xanthovirga aplysinae]